MDSILTTPSEVIPETAPVGVTPGNTPEPVAAPLDWASHIPKGSEKVFDSYKGKGLTDVLSSVVEAQKLIGGSIRLPKADAPQTEKEKVMGEVYNKLGRPETAEKYDLGELPALGATAHWDEGRLTAAKTMLHKAGLSNDQAKAVMGLYAEQMKTLFPDPSVVANESKAALVKEYGSEAMYNRNLGFAKKAITTFGKPELVTFLDSTGLGNHPPFVKFMADIGKELMEHGAVEPATPQDLLSQEDAQKQVTAIMNDQKDLYFSKPGTPGKAERMAEVANLYRIIAGEV